MQLRVANLRFLEGDTTTRTIQRKFCLFNQFYASGLFQYPLKHQKPAVT